MVSATPSRLTPGKDTRHLLCRRLGGLQGPSEQLRKISSTPGLFLFKFSCSPVVFIFTCFFVLIVLTFVFFLLPCNTRNTNIHAPGGIDPGPSSPLRVATPRELSRCTPDIIYIGSNCNNWKYMSKETCLKGLFGGPDHRHDVSGRPW